MKNFAGRCAATVPAWMDAAFGNVQTDEESHLLSVSIAAEQCSEMMANGVEHLHFYTLNNPDLTFDICTALGIEPVAMQGVVGGTA